MAVQVCTREREIAGIMGSRQARHSGGTLTREQFMLSEMRIVASLKLQGESDDEIVSHVVRDNLFQYLSARSLNEKARNCVARFNTLCQGDQANADACDRIVRLIAQGMPDQAAQANLYILMKRYDLVRSFMLEEIGGRFSCMDSSFTKADLGSFFTRFQLEYPDAEKWSDETIKRLKSVLVNCLVQVGFLETTSSETLQTVFIDYEVEQAIRDNGDADLLFAFNGTTVM